MIDTNVKSIPLTESSCYASASPDNASLDFTGIKFINPGEYGDLSSDAYKCVKLAQTEMLAVSVAVYQVSSGFTGAIKGNIATVGRDNVIQEIDPNFTPNPDIPHLMIHEKSRLNSDVQPGDEVVINYVDGSARVIPADKDAKYVYDIDFDGDVEMLKHIAKFLATESEKGLIRLTSNKIAEVVANAVTNAHHTSSKIYDAPKPKLVSVEITEYVKTLDLKKEQIKVSDKLLKAKEIGYKLDLQESTDAKIVFVGTPDQVEKIRHNRNRRMGM